MFGALQGCCYQGETDFPRGTALFLYQEYIQMKGFPSSWQKQAAVSKFLVAKIGPSGSCMLRKLHLSSLLETETFLSWPAILPLPAFPAPGSIDIFQQQMIKPSSFLSFCICLQPKCRLNSARSGDLVYLPVLKKSRTINGCNCNLSDI